MRSISRPPALPLALVLLLVLATAALGQVDPSKIYNPGQLKPTDSELKVKAGDLAPDFTLPAVGGSEITLSSFRGKANVVLSFVPAAWTPVCSGQWPGYNMLKEKFLALDAILLGITVDNIPTLFAWTTEMSPDRTGVWFPVLSDFFPHGVVARRYGILRSEGTSERAVFVVDKEGRLAYVEVSDINVNPDLQALFAALQALQ